MKKWMLALLTGAMFMMSTSAMATPIYGTVSFGGTDAYTGGTTAATATGIDFLTTYVTTSTGNFSALLFPDAVTFNDFTFSPSFIQNNPLWTITKGGITYSFDMTSLITQATLGHLVINGTGTLYITGYDATPGTWTFSTDDNTQTTTLTFSATAATVPEPGTMVLLGVGMLGLAIFGKRRMNKEA